MTEFSETVRYLREHSYREGEVLQSADMNVFGDRITFWPITEPFPVRLHYFGETFEYAEQQVGERWEKTNVLPGLLPNEIKTEHGTILPGEYIVHPHHGVGIFEYIVTRQGEPPRQFVSLQYAGNDRLLFPWERVGELMPYIGAKHPRLTRLNSKLWQNTKERIQRDLIAIARELLRVYAGRRMAKRDTLSWDSASEKLLLKEAGFSLTEDQARAIADIRQELSETETPMDRLLCGDVGFGKTEVAIHAALQVVLDGRQVAFMAPTTILAQQHFISLQKRLQGFPVTIQLALGGKLNKEVCEGVASGGLDILVGTHRVLSPVFQFKHLGLLVVDEEQKFGVGQKERLKEVRPTVDVLSMSATPIPRTLSMSLSGLRSLSILRSPPVGRKPVQTNIGTYNDVQLVAALKKELARGGQVYVVHNRVQSIAAVARHVEELLAGSGLSATVEIAHGQLEEGKIGPIIERFISGKTDILVASSIVEHGLDSPGANTLIVLHSEWFGLSDLYQLRGRVGRRKVQAYAYFFLGGMEHRLYGEADAVHVSATAKERLQALKEADELGSGWSVALRDLEIRGGGNILGHEQHGSMEAIGLLLYSQLLQEEIGRQSVLLGLPVFPTRVG